MDGKNTVAIITGTLPFQKYFCVEMAQRQNVVAIIHPGHGARPTTSKFNRLRNKIKDRGVLRLIPDQIAARPYIAASRKHGAIPHFLHHLGRTGNSKYLGWSRAKATQRADDEFFRSAPEQFAKSLSEIATTVDDINSDEAVAILRDIDADVVICLGGPLYRPPLINACRLILNYHTGISPIYNGTGTIYWCFANGHINLSGATLMVMSDTIDGGDILGHYLPSIEAIDDPARLFAKCVVGGVSMYDKFLNQYWSHKTFTSVIQPDPLFYYRGFHWNVTQNLSIQKIIDSHLVKRFQRNEVSYEYWAEKNNLEAAIRLRQQISEFMFGSEMPVRAQRADSTREGMSWRGKSSDDHSVSQELGRDAQLPHQSSTDS